MYVKFALNYTFSFVCLKLQIILHFVCIPLIYILSYAYMENIFFQMEIFIASDLNILMN